MTNGDDMTPSNIPLLFISPDSYCKTEGDCACSSSIYMQSPEAGILDAFHIPDAMIQLPLNDEFEVYLPPHGQRGASVLNKEAVSALRSFDALQKVSPSRKPESNSMLSGFLAQGLLESNSLPEAITQQSEMLTAWLHITDRCNLDCSYCYLPHVREDMSNETASAVLQSILRSAQAHQYKRIKLKYAGGEPLIRFPFISQLHDHAKTYFEESGFQFSAVLLSNGTLMTDEIARTLVAKDISLMISLDGMGQYHDSQRPYAGGAGSFLKVAAGIEIARANGLAPFISITVSANNINGLPSLLNWVLEKGLPFNLNFYRENELSEKHGELQYNDEIMIEGLLNAIGIIEANLPRDFSLARVIDRTNLFTPHSRICDAGTDYLVFDQNGQVAQCQMLLRKPVANINDSDVLTAIRKDRAGLLNLPVENKEGCRSCEWKNWCAGGCPLTAFRVSGRYDRKSPNCQIYKTILPEILRLEGLRILKFGSNIL